MKRIILLSFWLLSLLGLHAQELTVKSMEVAPMDLSASTQPRNDLNGNPCALVKVQLVTEGVKFEGNVIGDAAFKEGEYWVYMSAGSYLLEIKHPKFLPLMVNFRDYDIKQVEAKTTYFLTLPMPQGRVVVVQQQGESKPLSAKQTFTVNGVSFDMVCVKGGSFMIGEDNSEVFYAKKQHNGESVTVSAFFIGETEVTQELWQAVMGTNPSSHVDADTPNLPVEKVSWKDCQKFIRKLNKLTGRFFRLPTEAEWEYAARGGHLSEDYLYSESDKIDDVAWWGDNSGRRTHPVKTKMPNELGIYDMTGNVCEWCQDYIKYSDSHPLRGGTASEGSNWCYVWFHNSGRPSLKNDFTGLRLAK